MRHKIAVLVILIACISLISCDKEIYGDTEPAPMVWKDRTDSVGGFELRIKMPDFVHVPDSSYMIYTSIHFKPEKYEWTDIESVSMVVSILNNGINNPDCFIGKYRMVSFITIYKDEKYGEGALIHKIYTCFRNAEVFTQQRTKVYFDDFSPITEEDSIMFVHSPGVSFFETRPWYW